MKNAKYTNHEPRTTNHIAILLSLMIVWLILAQAECIAATLTITASHGSVTATPDKTQYDYGEVVQLIPKPETGYCFTGWQGDARGKSLVLNLTMDSDKTIIANFDTWKPPIGIPMPEFGIFETYRMYDDPAKRNPALTYNQNAEGGCYTHYIDNTHSAATDTGNTYGTESVPRLTIPRNMPAGSVVEIHNSAKPHSTVSLVDGIGTADKPIFVRGVGAVYLGHPLHLGYWGNAQYIIVENISWQGGSIYARNDGEATFETSYIAIRDCNFSGTPDISGGLKIQNSYSTNSMSHIVIYDSMFHDNGVWDPLEAEGDQDYCGLSVTGKNVSYIWILDNLMYHNSGDGFTVNSGSAVNQPTTHHIFAGRNISHHNKQTGMWAKQAMDIIYSQNEVYGQRASTSSYGQGMGYQYSPERIWFLFNTIHDCEYGITSSTNGGGIGTESYYIGNVIYDIHYDPSYGGYPYGTDSVYYSAGINSYTGGINRHYIGNTIYDCDGGIYAACAGGGSAYFYNNIISNIGNDGTYHIFSPDTGSFPWLANNNLLYRTGGSSRIKSWVGLYTTVTLPVEKGTNNVEGNPLFVNADSNDFRLQPTSPAIDMAISSGVVQEVYDRFETLYGIDIRKDIEGNPRTEPWDIGAYEYVPQEAILYGDVSGEGEISAYDAALTAQAAVELITLTAEQAKAADVSGDGEISAYDAALIAQRAVGLIDKFPVE